MAKKSFGAITEAARCSALASHAAAGLVVTASASLSPSHRLQLKEAERLLRGAEALSRCAASILVLLGNTITQSQAADLRDSVPSGSLGAHDAVLRGQGKKQRKKKKGVMASASAPVDAIGDVSGAPVSASAPTRALRAQTSRERSPRGKCAEVSDQPSSDVPSPCFAINDFVVIGGLVQKPDVNGKVGTVLFYDSTTQRYAVRVGSGCIKIRGDNLTKSIFHPLAETHG